MLFHSVLDDRYAISQTQIVRSPINPQKNVRGFVTFEINVPVEKSRIERLRYFGSTLNFPPLFHQSDVRVN